MCNNWNAEYKYICIPTQVAGYQYMYTTTTEVCYTNTVHA